MHEPQGSLAIGEGMLRHLFALGPSTRNPGHLHMLEARWPVYRAKMKLADRSPRSLMLHALFALSW